MVLEKSPIRKRSILLGNHKTSISLEDAFWDAVKDSAEARGVTVGALIAQIDRRRGSANLSSAIRVFVLEEQIKRSKDQQRH